MVLKLASVVARLESIAVEKEFNPLISELFKLLERLVRFEATELDKLLNPLSKLVDRVATLVLVWANWSPITASVDLSCTLP
ncbi:hypothetical protein SALWKB12_2055 [Snodgrassella communis]|nr:hypothetical protein SALWKB12_2055 [Snodgrassella communis]